MAEEDKYSHTIFTTLSNILELEKDKLSLASSGTITKDQASIFQYALATARNIKTRLYELPDIFLSLQNLDQINTPLTSLHNELSNYVKNKNSAHLNNARTYTDTALKVAAWALPLTNNSKVSRKIENEISIIQAASTSAIAKVESEKEKLIGQISELSQKLNDQDQKIANLTHTFDAKAAEANTASAEVKTAYAKLEAEFNTKFGEQSNGFKTAFDNLKSGNEKVAGEMLAQIEKHETDAKEIVELVGNIGVTGKYSNLAVSEKSQANIWRWITVGLFCLGVLFITINLGVHIYKEITVTDYNPNLTSLILRTLGAFAIALPAFYTSRESARHRTNADRAKQTELELASLGPFMESLPDDKKEELRIKLTDSYFGNQIENHDIKSPLDIKDFSQLMKSLTEFTTAVKK